MNSPEVYQVYRGKTIWELTGRQEFEGLEPTNWWIITGGPSTGKSTLLKYLSEHGYKTMPEAARVLIDKEKEKGRAVEEIRARESDFQEVVLEMKNLTEEEIPSDELVFWDRGNLGDSIAYMTTARIVRAGNDKTLCLYNFDSEDTTELLMRKKYRGVFILDRLSSYERDYARVEDDAGAARIHERINRSYQWLGYEPIRVPIFSQDESESLRLRAEFVLSHVANA